ncbi:hypothetical protein D9M73_154770 [compost metagenome]
MPGLALDHGLACQPVEDLEQLPARHRVASQELGFEEFGRDFPVEDVVHHTQVEVFEGVADGRYGGFLDLPGVLFQKIAAIGLLDRDVPLGEQGEYPADGGAGDIEGLGEGLLAQWLAGLHRPGADHLDDARGQLQGEVFLDHRLYSECLTSVDPADLGRTGAGKYHTRRT